MNFFPNIFHTFYSSNVMIFLPSNISVLLLNHYLFFSFLDSKNEASRKPTNDK